MKRLLLLAFAFCYAFAVSAQTVQSPEQFLGYKIGSHFTPHYKIVDYFKSVDKNSPAMVKLEQYGQTNEGRPLLLAFISSAENISNLENIRLNNLRLAGMTMDKMAPLENTPAIVWLSYNVHGNEASSSEAAMQTLFELVDPSNTKTKEWLKNTVVIIDPCMNPDGRDRYVNWFNGVLGSNYNSSVLSREHEEPWPGGRINHYYFDLNRDWAWQTQIETQQRIIKYNQWLPQVHVDYHEQMINNPYYFAPAAEPYHDIITKWQREFQVTIGKNHAKYFDANGWLYFTKEIFDLFYPSYGDTYPVYNGSIGMTYEQAGHSKGGLAVVTGNGDLLTLADRISHHVTTGLSTVEVSSLNAGKLVKEFRRFYDEARSNGYGEYKTYVLRPGRNSQALTDLLRKNGIQFGKAIGANIKGWNYSSQKEELFSISNNDIVVSAAQPKSALVKVLFEPNTHLADSATYDITAWALPYVYGLEAYAVKEKLPVNYAASLPAVMNKPTDAYAYLIQLNQSGASKAIAQLISKGIKLRYAEKSFVIDGKNYDAGTIIITKTSNQSNSNWQQVVCNIANELGIVVSTVNTGFVDKGYDFGSEKVRFITTPKVVLLSGSHINPNAMGEIWHYFDKELQYPLTIMNTESFNISKLKDYNTLILADGDYSFFSDKTTNENLKAWVKAGGKIIAFESAVAAMAAAEWGIKKKKEDDKKEEKKDNPYEALKRYENRERDAIPSTVVGAIYKVELDNSHPLALGYSSTYYTLKQNNDVYDFFTEGGWNVGVIRKNNYVTGFTGSKSKEKIKDGLIFGVEDLGSGNVVYFADNIIFRSFWENGKQLLCNAVFFVGQ
jgi:hypothetical protein